jgi:hypothetical protein
MTSIRTHPGYRGSDEKNYLGHENLRSRSLFHDSSDSIVNCFLRRSIQTCPPRISDGTCSKVGIVGQDILCRNRKLWSNMKLGREEEEEGCSNAREVVKRQEVTSQDKTIELLSVQIAQRDNIIKQLEDVVSQQQKLLEETLLSSEYNKPIPGGRICDSSLEGKNFEEVLNSLQHKIAERKKKRESITRRRMEMKQMIKDVL